MSCQKCSETADLEFTDLENCVRRFFASVSFHTVSVPPCHPLCPSLSTSSPPPSASRKPYGTHTRRFRVIRSNYFSYFFFFSFLFFAHAATQKNAHRRRRRVRRREKKIPGTPHPVTRHLIRTHPEKEIAPTTTTTVLSSAVGTHDLPWRYSASGESRRRN